MINSFLINSELISFSNQRTFMKWHLVQAKPISKESDSKTAMIKVFLWYGFIIRANLMKLRYSAKRKRQNVNRVIISNDSGRINN